MCHTPNGRFRRYVRQVEEKESRDRAIDESWVPPVHRANWLGAAIGLGAGALVGTAVSGGSTALAALLPVPLVAIDSAVSRSGGGLRDRSIVLGLTAALIAVVLFWNADVRQGFSDLVQGSVVAGVLLAVGLVLRGVVRRQRA